MSKYTNEQIADKIMSEGLGYTVQHYLSYEKIQDSELAELWKQAGDVLNKIDEKLKEFYY